MGIEGDLVTRLVNYRLTSSGRGSICEFVDVSPLLLSSGDVHFLAKLS